MTVCLGALCRSVYTICLPGFDRYLCSVSYHMYHDSMFRGTVSQCLHYLLARVCRYLCSVSYHMYHDTVCLGALCRSVYTICLPGFD